MENPVYEDTPLYDWWLKLVLGGVLALTFALGILLLFDNIEAALVMFGVTAFDAVLFKALLPQRFQVFHNRLRIVLGGPLALNIPFSWIAEARPASGIDAFAHWGLRFATSTRNMVEVVGRGRWNVVFCVSDRDTFLQQLNQAIEAARPDQPA